MPKVTVFASSSSHVPAPYLAAAHSLGTAIAQSSWNLIYGGNATGCMGELAKGARDAGGHVTGVCPQVFVDKGLASPHCHDFILTPDMRSRKKIMEESADAFIAFPGGIGTLEELFEILVAKQIGLHDKPLIILNLDHYFDPFIELIEHGQRLGFIRPGTLELMSFPPTVGEAIDRLLTMLRIPIP